VDALVKRLTGINGDSYFCFMEDCFETEAFSIYATEKDKHLIHVYFTNKSDKSIVFNQNNIENYFVINNEGKQWNFKLVESVLIEPMKDGAVFLAYSVNSKKAVDRFYTNDRFFIFRALISIFCIQ
jgi:hypothetical protein